MSIAVCTTPFICFVILLTKWYYEMQPKYYEGYEVFEKTSWVPPTIASLGYLLIVVTAPYIPRPAMEVREAMLVYNAFQVHIMGLLKSYLGM